MKNYIYDFTAHLYVVARLVDKPLIMKTVSEEWDWWVKEHGIDLNTKTWQEYTDAVFFCKGLIEDYPK